jgi:hypothetical protein
MRFSRARLRSILLSLALALPGGSADVTAITFDDLAGVYVGKRTETTAEATFRYDEVTLIEPDGLITNYIFADWLPGGVWSTQGHLEINEDGSFLSGLTGVGRLELHGRSLDVLVHFDAQIGFPSWPETVVHARLHRTDRPLESLAPWPF